MNTRLPRVVALLESDNDNDDLSRLAMRLSTTFVSISEVFVTLDRATCFTCLNHESERLLQRSSSELLGKLSWQQFGDNLQERLKWHIQQALTSNRRVEFEDFFESTGLWLELRSHPFADGLAVYNRQLKSQRVVALRALDP